MYTANGASNDISVIDVKSRKELRRIKVGDGPWGIAVVSAVKCPPVLTPQDEGRFEDRKLGSTAFQKPRIFKDVLEQG